MERFWRSNEIWPVFKRASLDGDSVWDCALRALMWNGMITAELTKPLDRGEYHYS